MAYYMVTLPGGQQYGPADENTLAQWATEGRISPQTQLVSMENQAVTTVAAVLQFAGVGAAPSAQPYPQQPYAAQPQYGSNSRVLPYAGVVTGAMGNHALTSFPVWGIVVLHFVTFGIFPMVYTLAKHGALPKMRHDDPGAGKAIGFMFIPFFNLYWVFFANLRLIDRINEQRAMAGLPQSPPKGLVIATLVCGFIPFVNYITLLILYPIYWGMMQSSVNQLVARTRPGM